MNKTKFILALVTFLSSVNAAGEITSERVPLDFSIRLGMTTGTLNQGASANEDEIPVSDYSGNPISLGINYDAGPDLTLSAELWMVAVGTSLLAEKGLYFMVGSSRVDLQACKLEYSIVSPK